MSNGLKAPYPWFGGKRAVAAVIWEALGDPAVYIEPFLGSASILLARPHAPKVEEVLWLSPACQAQMAQQRLFALHTLDGRTQ